MSDDILKVSEAADFLKIKTTTLYNWINQGKITCYKINNKLVYFKKDDLLNFIFNEKNLREVK
jgi:excisionase family DNA binding protein